MLNEMSDIAPPPQEHKAWRSQIDMCMPMHRRGHCALCMENMDMNPDQMYEEYWNRLKVVQARESGYSDAMYWIGGEENE